MNKILKKQAVQLMNCLFFIFLCGNCLAQKAYPEIRVSYISELQKGIQDSHWILDSDLVSSPGMIPFGNGNYTRLKNCNIDTGMIPSNPLIGGRQKATTLFFWQYGVTTL
jgi:hypothetical protein